MEKGAVSTRRILDDVRAGLTDEALREKHGLSLQQLVDIFRELAEEGLVDPVADRHVPVAAKRVCAVEMVQDIRTGMTGAQLIAKHGLSHAGLQSALDNLLATRALELSDLPGELSLRLAAGTPAEIRGKGRCYLDFDLPILEKGPLEIEGRVLDITETGVGVVGIPAKAGDVKTLLIRHDLLVLIQPFSFQAECRWTRETEADCLAGFRIARIAERDVLQLRKLIRLVTLYG
jgi:hypothetical protein